MGILISKKNEENAKPIMIKGTEIEIPSIYGRLDFVGRQDGKSLEVGVITYASEEAYNSESSPLSTDCTVTNFRVEQLAVDETQSIETALKYTVQLAIEMGYECVEI